MDWDTIGTEELSETPLNFFVIQPHANLDSQTFTSIFINPIQDSEITSIMSSLPYKTVNPKF